ncbi:MAG: hypothetical protein WA539_11845, partial [Candidatus Sulfotelmatobacter sp.]
MSTQTIGAMHGMRPVNNRKCKPLQYNALLIWLVARDRFYTKAFTAYGIGENPQPKPNIHLDAERLSAHLAISRKELAMSELVAYVDGGSLGNPGPSGIGVVIDGCE